MAVAASMLTDADYMLRDGVDFHDPSTGYFVQHDKAHVIKRLLRRFRDLGVEVEVKTWFQPGFNLDKSTREAHAHCGGGRIDEKRVSQVGVFELLEGNSRKKCRESVRRRVVRSSLLVAHLRGFASRPDDFVV